MNRIRGALLSTSQPILRAIESVKLKLSKIPYSPKIGIEIINCVPCPKTDSQIKFPP
jgi:hypothetical protein